MAPDDSSLATNGRYCPAAYKKHVKATKIVHAACADLLRVISQGLDNAITDLAPVELERSRKTVCLFSPGQSDCGTPDSILAV